MAHRVRVSGPAPDKLMKKTIAITLVLIASGAAKPKKPEPQRSPLIFERGPDPQVRRSAWNDVLSLLEAYSVETHQPGLRRQPQVTRAGLENLEDAPLRQALLGLPDAVDILRQFAVRIETKGCFWQTNRCQQRKAYRRTRGHRQSFTSVKVTGISEG